MSTSGISKTPSLQHLAKLYGATPAQTAERILRLQANRPPRTFEARHYLQKRLKGMPYEAVLSQAALDKREPVKNAALETLPLLEEYLDQHDLRWFRPMEEVLYEVAPGLLIPMRCLGFASVDGSIKALWPQMWKTETLTPSQFNFWATVFKRAVPDRFPDIEGFDWLEMSRPKGKKERELRVRTEEAAHYLSDQELRDLREHLEVALKIVAEAPRRKKPKPKRDPRQGRFWDDDPGSGE